MEITAKAKFVRTSPRKLRLVARQLEGLTGAQALVVLGAMGKRAALPLRQTLQSALSNAQFKGVTAKESLKIKKIEIGGGPIYKRFQPVARGRAHPIAKRTSHITVVLEEEK